MNFRRRPPPGNRRDHAAHRSRHMTGCSPFSLMMGAAKAVSVVTPTTGLPAASAMPRAAERPTRNPVKLPGPAVAAMRSSSRERNARCFHHARDQRHQGFGMAALHRLRFLRDEIACGGVENGRGAGIERRIDSEDQHDASVEVFQRRLNDAAALFSAFHPSRNSGRVALPLVALPVETLAKMLAPHFRRMCIIMQLLGC